MEVIESIKKDKAYVKCKLIVKTWENDFKTKYSRTPSKFDIKEAPSKIKYAYKKYFQLKSSALENTLSLCDIDDNLDESHEPIISDITLEAASLSPEKDLPLLPSGQELDKLMSSVQHSSNELHPFTENLSKKLFLNRKFCLRNPRKFCSTKFQSMSDDTNKTQIIENCVSNLISVSKCTLSNETNNLFTNEENVFSPVPLINLKDLKSISNVRKFDKAWLKRTTGIETEELDHKVYNNYEEKEKFGIRNIDILTKKPMDVVENSDSEDDITISKLKPALKKRKVDNVCDSEYKNRHNESITDNFHISDQKELLSKGQMNKGKKKKQSKKQCSEVIDHPPDVKEYVPFGIDTDILPRHSFDSKTLVSNIISTTEATAKVKKVNESAVSTANDALTNKIKLGTLNDNFVKINIEKKVFVRGKKNLNFSKYKKQQWKNKKALHGGMEFPESGKISCFKCGGSGHMSRYCTAHKGESLLPLQSYNENDLLTLEDMQKYVSEQGHNKQTLSEQLNVASKTSEIPESFLNLLEETKNTCSTDIKPIYSTCQENHTNDLLAVLHKFGHQSFRSGQEEAIKRILSGMSTLLILSTGGGKSLCYQLPAYIYSQHYKCVTLVISPLVSLMEDQVLNMPDFLKAGCLHTNQPSTQRSKIIQCLKDGLINILLISPEALISGDTSNGFAGLFKSLPPIAFACIDEAHCVSQWSHNFRPSYLMISRVLREKLNVKCILGLTATASQTTIKSIISHLNVPDGMSGVITNPTLPDNLCLSVSFEKDKDKGLISFLNSERICLFNSIIVYCIRRDECVRVAAMLRASLQEVGKINMEKQSKKRKRMSYIAEAYHAGMSPAQRRKIQNNFMDGTLRIIVATVAFGMGINKSDIRCIVHYNMPSSFESYVQEVGRAGRDGEIAFCHVLMNNSNNDKSELLKHIHANSTDRPTIRKLLQKVFIPCECVSHQTEFTKKVSDNQCKGHEVGISIDDTVEELDLPSENIATLLCYVELHFNNYIKVLNNAYTMCKIASYGGPQMILQAAKTCVPLAMAILLESKKDPSVVNKSVIEFNVIQVSAAVGWESGVTKYQLKNLEWISEAGTSRRSHLKIEFHTLGFKIKARGDLTPTELDNVLDQLYESVLFQEKTKLYQLEECNEAFKQLVDSSKNNGFASVNLDKSNELKLTIRNYFQRDNTLPEHVVLEERTLDIERVISDVRALISSYKDCTFTGRSIARIFQGISSPNFPAIVWGRCKFWRSHIHEDFNGLIKIATQQIIQMKV